LVVELTFKKNIKDGNLLVKLTRPGSEVWVAKESKFIYFRERSVLIKGVEFFSSGDEEALKSAGTATSGATSAVVVVMTLVSASSAVALIKIFQMIDYMVFYNVPHPRNLISYMEVLSSPLLDYIPNPFESISDDKCKGLGAKFVEQEYGCHLLENSGNLIFLILVLFSLKAFFAVLASITKRKKVENK
jgi:hypothetical protein